MHAQDELESRALGGKGSTRIDSLETVHKTLKEASCQPTEPLQSSVYLACQSDQVDFDHQKKIGIWRNDIMYNFAVSAITCYICSGLDCTAEQACPSASDACGVAFERRERIVLPASKRPVYKSFLPHPYRHFYLPRRHRGHHCFLVTDHEASPTTKGPVNSIPMVSRELFWLITP